MKRNKTNNYSYSKYLKIFAIVVFTVLMAQCIFLDSVDYEPSVIAGQEATYTMRIRIEPAENSATGGERLVIGYLVPKSWRAADNTVVTYTSTIDEGIKTMSLMPKDAQPKNMQGRTWPAALKERFGFGPNVLDDMEWVVYQTDGVYNVTNGEKIAVTVKLKTKTGTDNIRVKLGFFVNNSNDGFSTDTQRFKVMYTDCIDVVGPGPLTDFCQLHINSAQPLFATKNDLITIKYQGDLFDNPLDDQDEIYLCATAFTEDEKTYTVCGQAMKSRMLRENPLGHTFSLTFWPAGYFGIPEGEEISRIQYSFKNAYGTIELKNVLDDGQNTEVPFEYIFTCM
ncbi:DUF4961 domain-containing protein [Gaoshiqia sp. Z1-71]|uniref:DUF4961 domain-containing protein n=1 Tax=Gaoshiqia hydrogeniformans TaxID=3290090 RepID=UPI003BF89E1D